MALSFETSRLNVVEIEGSISLPERSSLIERIPQLLTPSVVQNLPPYFHGISTKGLAEGWLEQMLSECRLLQVNTAKGELAGFLFAYVDEQTDAHIGYLLAEKFWGQGLAQELLKGFIQKVSVAEPWVKLIGGVDRSNVASSHLLRKMGFKEQKKGEGNVVFLEYTIQRP